jgi:hypothetical protein
MPLRIGRYRRITPMITTTKNTSKRRLGRRHAWRQRMQRRHFQEGRRRFPNLASYRPVEAESEIVFSKKAETFQIAQGILSPLRLPSSATSASLFHNARQRLFSKPNPLRFREIPKVAPARP